jgi:large subunit ribosomal protein L3
VIAVKTTETDGYNAIVVTTGSRKASRLNSPERGQFKKAGVECGRGLWEFRLSANDPVEFKVGDLLTHDQFTVGQKIDVIGKSKGKGFAGTVKRHNFRTQDNSHGNSRSHRVPGSIGQNQTPGRVFKNKKMAGRMGNERVTIQNLEIVRVDADRNVLLIKGAIPGCVGGDVIVRSAVKHMNTEEKA